MSSVLVVELASLCTSKCADALSDACTVSLCLHVTALHLNRAVKKGPSGKQSERDRRYLNETVNAEVGL